MHLDRDRAIACPTSTLSARALRVALSSSHFQPSSPSAHLAVTGKQCHGSFPPLASANETEAEQPLQSEAQRLLEEAAGAQWRNSDRWICAWPRLTETPPPPDAIAR